MFTKSQVFKFVSDEIFNSSTPADHLFDNLLNICNEYKAEVIKILTMCLKAFAIGFEHQKGAIFGFGDKANETAGTVLKISDL